MRRNLEFFRLPWLGANQKSMLSMITSEASFRTLVIVLGVAFLLKTVLLLGVLPIVGERLSPFYSISFADDYDKLALSIAEGQGYRFFPDTAPTMMREPGYPILLSGVFAAFGYSLPAARFANLILSAASAVIIALLANVVSKRCVVVLGAPLLFMFHPGTIIAESRGGFEILFTFSLLLFILALSKAIEDGRPRWYVLAGVILGCVVLIRSTLVLFPLLLLGYLWFRNRRSCSRLTDSARVMIMIGAMLAVMAPWIFRNYMLVERIVPTTSVQGIAAHAGQFICKNLTFDNELQQLDTEAALERGRLASKLGYSHRDGYYQYFYRTNDELEFSSYLLRMVLSEYADSPILVVKCASVNLFNFWFAGKNWRATSVNVIIQLPLLALATVGIWFAFRDGRMGAIAPMALVIAYLMLLHAPIHAQARYSMPLIPFLSILACYGIASILGMYLVRKEIERPL